eukprot:m.145635 g.145635  ORF g.145635 m.145635 type:complete len:526 (-) comp30448_c4_seq1:120-1697(-)
MTRYRLVALIFALSVLVEVSTSVNLSSNIIDGALTSWVVYLPRLTPDVAVSYLTHKGYHVVQRHVIDGHYRIVPAADRQRRAFTEVSSSVSSPDQQHSLAQRYLHQGLLADEEIDRVLLQQPHRPRVRRNTFTPPNDPNYVYQWYVNQSSVPQAWSEGVDGSGVVLAIVDDGLAWDHPDIAANYDASASHNFIVRSSTDPHGGESSDPYPDQSKAINYHGTKCAGVAAAVFNNSMCGVGVAYGARVGGIRMLDDVMYDSTEAGALAWNRQHIDIYSCSWGPPEDGKFDGPHALTQEALAQGVAEGRGGLGSIFVWAGGNGGDKDQCAADGYVNDVRTIAINGADQDGTKPYYGERCTAVLASTYSQSLSTVDDSIGECTRSFSGTSAAAPLASAIFALALDVNPCLTWRDLQHLVVQTSTPSPASTDTIVTGAGHSVSPTFGFGLLNATALVQRARVWSSTVGAQVKITTAMAMDNNNEADNNDNDEEEEEEKKIKGLKKTLIKNQIPQTKPNQTHPPLNEMENL